MVKIAPLMKSRSKATDRMAELGDFDRLTAAQDEEFQRLKAEVKALDIQIEAAHDSQDRMRAKAQPVDTGDGGAGYGGVSGYGGRSASVGERDEYRKDKSLAVGGMLKMFAKAKGDVFRALDIAETAYGARHPVTEGMGVAKALSTTAGATGGFVIPPDMMAEIVPLLYNRTVVRKAGTMVLPMPHGTMTVPKMTSGAQATWVGEGQPIPVSQPGFGQVVATAHKLAAFVPITNDQMRYATPQFDAMVRNDVVTQIALAEDATFTRSMGTSYSPKGMRAFCLASNFINSASAFTLATVSSELGQAVTNLEGSNVPMLKPAWLMSPRSKNYLLNLQNAQGLYVYKDEMTKGTLLGYPFMFTNQIMNNMIFGGNADCSEIYFGDFSEMMILESRQMEFAISQDASFVDANGNTVSGFQNDMTLLRGLIAEDFQMRHDEAVTIIQGVRWKAVNPS